MLTHSRKKMNKLKAPKYSLPCIHCKESTLFPDTEALKKHLLSEHESLVSSPKVAVSQEERYGFKHKTNVPSSEVRINLSEQTINRYPSSFSPTRNISLSPQTSIYKSPVHSEVDFLADVSERKIKRLADTLRKKDEQVQSLTNANEVLKADMALKDEQQNRLRHRWRKEAEDVIRDLKTNYSDVLTQKQLLEKQLKGSEESKTRLRTDKDNLAKDFTDLQTKMVVEKRDLLQNNKTLTVNGKSSIDGTSVELQKLKLERDNLMTLVKGKDETIEKLHTSYECLHNQLSETQQEKEEAENKCAVLKGQLSALETNVTQSASRYHSQNKSVTSLSSKISRLETTNQEQHKEIESRDQRITTLIKDIETLKVDKQKLVASLENADLTLRKVSQHILPSSVTPRSPSSIANITSTDMKTSLEQIMAAVKKISSRDTHSANQEVVNLKKELQRLNLLLMEEKATVKRLTVDLSELEDINNEGTNEIEGASIKLLTKFEALKMKHKKCVHNEKVRKQLRVERKIFKKKYFEVLRQYDLLTVLFDSTKEELQHKNDIMEDVQKECKSMENGYIKALSTIDSLRQDVCRRDHELETYKRENCNLLEKFNKTSEEADKLQNTNENLEARLEDLEFVKNNVAELHTSIREISENGQLVSDLNNVANIEGLLERNRDLTKQNFELQRELHDVDQFSLSLQQKIAELEKDKSDLLSEKSRLQNELMQKMTVKDDTAEYETQIENLMLEKEILSSRIVILEGIREEMVILHSETDKLKRENQQMKKVIKYQEETSHISRKCSPTAGKQIEEDDLVLVKWMEEDNSSDDDAGDFVKTVKTLDDLGEEEKLQLNNILSMPDFQKFLSTDSVVIDLRDSSDTQNIEHTNWNQGLSTENFEHEHVVNHIYQVNSDESIHESSPKEFVQRLHETDRSKTDFPTESKRYKRKPRSFGQVYRMSSDELEKSLEKIFSESKLISSDIALQGKQNVSSVDCNRVLMEFDKVIKEMSTPSLTQAKQVKFSDHIMGAEKPLSAKGNSQPDTNFYKSFFQDALTKVYPQLAKLGDDEMSDDNSSSSHTASNNNSRESGLTEKVLEIMHSPPRVQHFDNQEFGITRKSSTSLRNEHALKVIPRGSSSLFAKNKTRTGSSQLFKNIVGVLPQITEQDARNELSDLSPKTESASNALNVLKSFIEKAGQIRVSPENSGAVGNNPVSVDINFNDEEDGEGEVTDDDENRSVENSSYRNPVMLTVPATANTPSTMHRPISFDFSDGSICSLSLFKVEDN